MFNQVLMDYTTLISVEACVSHEEILLVPVNDRDRVLETSRYRRAGVSACSRAAGGWRRL